MEKLKKRLKSKKLTKQDISNRGYNKFLSLTGEIEVEIDQVKIKEDESWDGLKGYVTNTLLEINDVVENYSHLWQIEKAFRISKTDLRIRPIYHRLQKRIEAHICIAFVAYAIFKELEQILENEKVPFSVKRAGELTHNMYAINFISSKSLQKEKIILKMDEEQEMLKIAIEKNC